MQKRSMRYKIKYFLLILLCWLSASCAGGDSAFKVKGSIKDINGDGIDGCILELYLAKNEQLVDKVIVGHDFEESFIIAPKITKYYMMIRCNGYSESYRTDIYKLGNIEYFNTPVELGEIVLKK